MWPSLAVTRLYPWVAWSDLKNAYLFDRTPVATRRAHGFMVYERNAKGPATLQHYHFMGLPMGSSSSAAALQTTTGILMELSNELSVARVANTNTATPIWNTLVNNIASEEEIQGLPVERLHGPSSAAKALAEVLRRLDKNARSASCSTDDDHEAKDKKARSSRCRTDDDHEAKDKKARSSSCRTDDDHEAKDKKARSSSCRTDDDHEAKDKKARSSSCPTDDDHEAKDKKARSSSCPTDDDHEAKDKKARSSSRRTEDDHEAKDKKTGSSSCPTDDDREAKENHSTVSARWKTLWKSGSKRVKFVDDVTTGAQTKETLSSLREDEKDCARRIGHVFNEAKEKRSNDETSAEGFGLVWTSAADGDQLKPKKVKSPILAQLSTAPVRLTVRNLLSLLHQAYDVIGILTWCLLPVKLILRECYTKRLQYDDFATGHQSLETVKTIQKFNRLVDSTVISRFVDLYDTVVLYADASAFGIGYAICNANPREIFAASSRLVPLHAMPYSIVRFPALQQSRILCVD
ncbi:hypothetical protein FOZ62_004475 [Perkinsus olseni]|uniref:Uncharacterized protein n=1 Tax=Perkinsus olseni TaxID=32597 RepID=A0A7J6QE73_PEROL|nr:hypothetical protein FOZ62_004475 [Perkinsus olseni]